MNSTEEKTIHIDGTDSLLVLEFCAKYNCTYEISFDQKSEWGELLSNGTNSGVMGAIADRKVEVGIAGLLVWLVAFPHMTYTTPLSRTAITCLVPRPKSVYSLY